MIDLIRAMVWECDQRGRDIESRVQGSGFTMEAEGVLGGRADKEEQHVRGRRIMGLKKRNYGTEKTAT